MIFILASIIGLITGFTIHYIVGLSLSVTSIILPLVFLFLIQYLLRHKDYRWSANVARLINRRLEIIRFLLQVLFMNPYAHRRLQTNDTTDCKKMKYDFKMLPRIVNCFFSLDLSLLNMEKYQQLKVKRRVQV